MQVEPQHVGVLRSGQHTGIRRRDHQSITNRWRDQTIEPEECADQKLEHIDDISVPLGCSLLGLIGKCWAPVYLIK
jgi:hypothetical protein